MRRLSGVGTPRGLQGRAIAFVAMIAVVCMLVDDDVIAAIWSSRVIIRRRTSDLVSPSHSLENRYVYHGLLGDVRMAAKDPPIRQQEVRDAHGANGKDVRHDGLEVPDSQHRCHHADIADN